MSATYLVHGVWPPQRETDKWNVVKSKISVLKKNWFLKVRVLNDFNSFDCSSTTFLDDYKQDSWRSSRQWSQTLRCGYLWWLNWQPNLRLRHSVVMLFRHLRILTALRQLKQLFCTCQGSCIKRTTSKIPSSLELFHLRTSKFPNKNLWALI